MITLKKTGQAKRPPVESRRGRRQQAREIRTSRCALPVLTNPHLIAFERPNGGRQNQQLSSLAQDKALHRRLLPASYPQLNINMLRCVPGKPV